MYGLHQRRHVSTHFEFRWDYYLEHVFNYGNMPNILELQRRTQFDLTFFKIISSK